MGGRVRFSGGNRGLGFNQMIPSVSQIIARRLRVTGLVVGWGGGFSVFSPFSRHSSFVVVVHSIAAALSSSKLWRWQCEAQVKTHRGYHGQ